MNSVPKISEKVLWCIEKDAVMIVMENKGLMNFLMQKFLNKPQKTIIHLDETGSFIWKKIDGKKTVREIALELESKFGDSVAPIYERLIKYLNTLCEYNFISFKKV